MHKMLAIAVVGLMLTACAETKTLEQSGPLTDEEMSCIEGHGSPGTHGGVTWPFQQGQLHGGKGPVFAR